MPTVHTHAGCRPTFLSDQRERSVLQYPLPRGVPPTLPLDWLRLVVQWGLDRGDDPMILDVLSAVYLRNRPMLERIVAVHADRGRLQFWCRTSPDVSVPDVRRALEDAAQCVMLDRWTVLEGVALPCSGELVDWQALPDGDPLKGVARSYGLGVHRKAVRRNGGV